MGLPALSDLDGHATWLSTAATRCRADADELRACATALTWDGLSGTAFREAIGAHARCLDLVACELEAAAAALRAHDAACRAVTAPAELAAAVIGAAAGLAPW